MPSEDALRRLDDLVGDWTMAVTGPDGEPWLGEATTRFYWHESGAFLVQEAAVHLPGAPNSRAIIGCDAARGTFSQLYSDDRGVTRIYDMTLLDRRWTLARTGDPFAQRYEAQISDDGESIAGAWEKADEAGNFSLDFSIVYRRLH